MTGLHLVTHRYRAVAVSQPILTLFLSCFERLPFFTTIITTINNNLLN